MQLREEVSICLEMIVSDSDVFLLRQPFIPCDPITNDGQQFSISDSGIPLNDEDYCGQSPEEKVGCNASEQYVQLSSLTPPSRDRLV